MKVYFGKYRNWFGPYQLAEALCFWVKDVEHEYGIKDKPHWVHQFGELLAHGSIEPERKAGDVYSWGERPQTLLYKFLSWVDKVKNKVPRQYIKIDRWDTWNMDSTLSPIILPMLKQLKATKHGSAQVDLEDVPFELQGTEHEEWADQKTFDFYHDVEYNNDIESGLIHKRWDWVLDEMIFAFDHLVDQSWEEKYSSGEHDITWTKLENGCSQMGHGPNNTYKCDYEGLAKEWQRVDNGLRLFGKYYRNLWD
jgi:hypothetical protein